MQAKKHIRAAKGQIDEKPVLRLIATARVFGDSIEARREKEHWRAGTSVITYVLPNQGGDSLSLAKEARYARSR